MTDERELVRSRTDIVELVGQRVVLKRVGKHLSGLCPFHSDRNPSFSVDPQTGRYRCWSCGESGDCFTWVMKTESVEFSEALKILADRAGVELSRRGRTEDVGERELLAKAMQVAQNYFRAQFKESSIARNYCEARGLSQGVIDAWELGYAPNHGEGLVSRLKRADLPLQTCKELFLVDQNREGGYYDKFRDRLMFPIYDHRAQLVGFGGRVLGDGQPKYMNSSDTKLYRKSQVLYGLKVAKESMMQLRKAVLVEGYLDTIACHRSGVTSAVASLGTALAEDHARLLKRFADEVTILYDNDSAGQKAAERAIEILQNTELRVKIASLPEGDDPDTLLRREGGQAVAAAVEHALTPTAFRLRRLDLRLTPDQAEYWTEAIAILAQSDGDLEREGHLLRLAGLYPHIRDVQVALARLTKMVVSARKATRRAGSNPQNYRVPEFHAPKEPLQAAETMVFGALHEAEYQKYVWITLKTPEIFATGTAIRLAQAISEAFPSAPPDGPSATWIHMIEPEEMRTLLSDINLNYHVSKLSEGQLLDAVARLRSQAMQQEIRRVRRGSLSPEERQEILERLKLLKPDANSTKNDNDDDPFS